VNLTILSTGLLNEADFSTLDHYADVAPVIVQYWISQDETRIPPMSNVRTLAVECPDYGDYGDYARKIYQVHGILCGLRACETMFVLRVRNDEHISDVLPLLDELEKDPKRLVCSNIFWPQKFPKHVGDHIMAARTDLLTATYQSILNDMLDGHMPDSLEEEILRTFVYYSRLYSPPDEDRENLADRVAVVPIDRLSPHRIINHMGDGEVRTWTNASPAGLIQTEEELRRTPLK